MAPLILDRTNRGGKSQATHHGVLLLGNPALAHIEGIGPHVHEHARKLAAADPEAARVQPVLVLGDDEVDVLHVGVLASHDARHPAARLAHLEPLPHLLVQHVVRQQVGRQIHGRRHDDGVQVQPPHPLGLRIDVEGLDDGRQLGPHGLGTADVVPGDVEELVVVSVQIGILLAVGRDVAQDVFDAAVVALAVRSRQQDNFARFGSLGVVLEVGGDVKGARIDFGFFVLGQFFCLFLLLVGAAASAFFVLHANTKHLGARLRPPSPLRPPSSPFAALRRPSPPSPPPPPPLSLSAPPRPTPPHPSPLLPFPPSPSIPPLYMKKKGIYEPPLSVSPFPPPPASWPPPPSSWPLPASSWPPLASASLRATVSGWAPAGFPRSQRKVVGTPERPPVHWRREGIRRVVLRRCHRRHESRRRRRPVKRNR